MLYVVQKLQAIIQISIQHVYLAVRQVTMAAVVTMMLRGWAL